MNGLLVSGEGYLSLNGHMNNWYRYDFSNINGEYQESMQYYENGQNITNTQYGDRARLMFKLIQNAENMLKEKEQFDRTKSEIQNR